jgi:two-component system, OmpR family, alkaline phosphatase synthesis response regulator PhoP
MENKKSILLIEDEKALKELIELNLSIEGFDVETAESGNNALSQFNQKKFDLIILDVMLPEIDGFTLCEKFRLTDKNTPILFLSAKSSGEDRIKGLKIGGDDYLPKPFNLEELILRVEKLIQRNVQNNISNTFTFNNMSVDFLTYEIVTFQNEKKKISDREIQLLKFLIENENKVVSRNDILEKVWGYDKFPTTRTIDNYILAFRKYFERDPKEPKHFHSIRSVGYKFTR